MPSGSGFDLASASDWAARLVEALDDRCQFQHCEVYVVDSDADLLRLTGQSWLAGQRCPGRKIGDWTLPLVGSIPGRVFRTAIPALVADVTLDPEYCGCGRSETGAQLVVPIVLRGRVAGVVNVERPRPGSLGIIDLERLLDATFAAAQELAGAVA